MALNFELKLSMQSIDFLIWLSQQKDNALKNWATAPRHQMFVVQARILEREGLISVTEIPKEKRRPGDGSNCWQVTEKGRVLIDYLQLEFKELSEGRMLAERKTKQLTAVRKAVA